MGHARTRLKLVGHVETDLGLIKQVGKVESVRKKNTKNFLEIHRYCSLLKR